MDWLGCAVRLRHVSGQSVLSDEWASATVTHRFRLNRVSMHSVRRQSSGSGKGTLRAFVARELRYILVLSHVDSQSMQSDERPNTTFITPLIITI